MVKNFRDDISNQNHRHEVTILKSKIFSLEEDKKIKDSKIQELQNVVKQQDNEMIESISSVKLSEIKLIDNIRDQYEYEDIQELANDTNLNGQLQAVLVSKDNYLLIGFRRYFAMKLLDKNFEVIVSRLDINMNDISIDYLKDIQYAENNQRRNIDNFQLSKLFNWYLGDGLTQKDLTEKFRKNKGTTSSIVKIAQIDSYLVQLMKEIQIFGVSKDRFGDPNTDQELTTKQKQFLEKRGIIGYKPLYNIAKYENIKEQKIAFIKVFGNRLSKDELESNYFSEIQQEKNKSFNLRAKKYLESLNKFLGSQDTIFTQSKEYEDIKKDIEELQNKLSNLNL